MKATLDCLECTVIQALRAARVATDDPAVHRRVQDEVCKLVPGMDLDQSPAFLSLVAYEIASELSGNPDPYKELRAEQNAFALSIEPELRAMVADSDDPLVAALHLSAAGNVIDLGTSKSQTIDIHGAVAQVMAESFAVEHLAEFRASLAACEDLLFLLDNAGEIVFDRILIEELLKHTKVTAVVKGAPILNDVVLDDARQVGLTEVCDIIDNGGPYIGAPLHKVPKSFIARMEQADMIVGKGQGNYETVDEFPGDVFLILRAKCPIIAEHMGVEFGQVGLISTRARAKGQGTT